MRSVLVGERSREVLVAAAGTRRRLVSSVGVASARGVLAMALVLEVFLDLTDVVSS